MKGNLISLSLDDTFRFSCHKHLTCYNQCCHDLNQLLTPFDILRLKNHLEMSSGDFLAQYTTQHTGPETGLPIIALNPANNSDLQCPFVAANGCQVYESRPSSCRMYPIVRAITRCRKTGKVAERFMLLKESHCLGFDQDKTQTLRQWIKDQGIAIYNKMNDMLMEIISLKNRYKTGPLDIKASRVFQMALYDLDTFRFYLFEKGLPTGLQLDPDTLSIVEKNDVELLKLGHAWVKKNFLA